MYEVLKCGFLRDKSLLYNSNYGNFDYTDMIDIIYKSLKVKLHYVKIDYKDFGDRRFLNFGHTIGHAIELLTNIKHGEAVGYGMLCEICISVTSGILSPEKFEECINVLLLNINSLPILRNMVSYKDVIKLINYDKKKIGGKVNFTLLRDITDPVIYDKVEEWQIKEAIFKYVDPTNL